MSEKRRHGWMTPKTREYALAKRLGKQLVYPRDAIILLSSAHDRAPTATSFRVSDEIWWAYFRALVPHERKSDPKVEQPNLIFRSRPVIPDSRLRYLEVDPCRA